MNINERQARLVKVAIEGFVSHGFHGLSIHMCGDKVSLAKGSLYHYIDSKLDLAGMALDKANQSISPMLDAFEETRDTDVLFEAVIGAHENVFNLLLPAILVEAGDAALTDKARECLKALKLKLLDSALPILKPFREDLSFFALLGLCLHQRIFKAPDRDALLAVMEGLNASI